MGFFDKINKLWSGADFWDKQENAQQRNQFAQQDEERKRRKAEALAQAQAQAQAQQQRQTQQQNVSVSDLPQKPRNVTVDAGPQRAQPLQIYKPTAPAPTLTVERPTAEQAAHTKKIQELEQFKTTRMARALEEEKKNTSWFDRQFTDRNWDKRAEARAISGATKDYQEKYGWNKDSAVINYGRGASKKLDQAQDNNASKWIAPVLSTGRVGTGIVQGVAGLYDLATPGEGTNRLSQASTKKAEEIDQLAKDFDIDGHYKTGNVVGEIGSYLIPGVIAAKAAKGVNATRAGYTAVTKAATKVDDIARLVDKAGDAGKFRKYVATRLRQNATLEEAIQEFMITGRYMGQNTASGGETTWQSAAIDAASGVGGSLLIPTRGLKNLFGDNADEAARLIDDGVAGADVPTASPIDAPPAKPALPEVAAGVKSTNIANNTPPPAAVTPPPQAPVAPPVQAPVQQAVPPVQQSLDLPEAPRVNEVPQLQQLEVPPQKPLVQNTAPVQPVPQTAPLTTPNQVLSQEVPTVAPVNPAPAPAPVRSADEGLDGLRGTRESLIDERNALLEEGYPVGDLDREIAALDRQIASEVGKPSKEAKVLAEGDKQLEESIVPPKKVNKKPEISKQEAPSKPKTEKGTTTRQMSLDEMKAAGMSDDAIANVMARRAAEVEAPKVAEPAKTDVAQSEPTPVKETMKGSWTDPDTGETTYFKTKKEANAFARKKTKEGLAAMKAESKTVAPEPAKVEAPSKPKPTQAELDEGAVANLTTKGTVKVAWRRAQERAGASPDEIRRAISTAEGVKTPPTPEQKVIKENRAENNKVARENKAKAEAEGKDKQAAPGVTDSLAKQRAQETATKAEVASIARRYSAQTKSVNIEEGLTKAQKSLDEVSDDGVLEHVRKLFDEGNKIDPADRVFNSIAVSKRLDSMRKAAGDAGLKLDKELVDLADEVAQKQALTASEGGLINRLTQEIYKNVPAPVRVQKRLDDLTKKFEEMKLEFKPSQADTDELIKMTDKFDSTSTSMLGFEDELNANMADFNGKTTPEQADELYKNHKQLEIDHKNAQKQAVADSLAFNEKLKSIIPELPKGEKFKQGIINAPDHVGNYLRLAMLSAPTGRIRDAVSTSINVVDQTIVDLISSTIGRVSNKTLGSNLISGYGGVKPLKKGIRGAWDKVKGSWQGKPTLDEATGRIKKAERAELNKVDSITSFGIDHGSKGSKWNIPKKAITAGVQAPTDVSYGLFTKRLYTLGEVDARSKGITDKKQIKQYAEMFMDNPTKEAALDAGDVWLQSSGMQKNSLSKKLTGVADSLEKWGNKTVGDNGNKLGTANRATRKTIAVTVRTTTIPFVQYTGGSTHAMLMRQNPISNISQSVKAFKAGDIQKGIDNLSRTAWNSAKIAGVIAAMESNIIETSDTDADGKTTYNGPYVVRNGEYIPMGSYGIAGGSALISAHFLRRGYDKMKNGDVFGGISDIVAGPPMAIVKASGLDNMLSGTNIIGGATENFERANNNPNMTPGDVAVAVGAGVVGDIGSQAVPALSRDINSFVDQNPKYNPTGEKPDTSGKDPATGRVDPIRKAVAQITSGIPGLSQNLPRKSGQQARDFTGRILNANTQSAQQAAEIKAKKTEETTTINRTADVVKDDKVANLLSEETRAIYDKYKGDMSKASEEDSKKIWSEVTSAKDRLLDDGSYDSYSKILTYERDEAKASGSKTETEIAKMDRDITRSDVASKRKTDPQIFRLYTGTDAPDGGGISQSEFKKMLQLDDDGNPEYPESYDPDTATLLWELDQAMTEANASANGTGIDPWTRNKYNLDAALGRGKYAKKGSGGGKDKGISTDFGTLGAYAKGPGAQSQKYQKLTNAGSPLPNLTANSSRTKLRKNISVVKGVRL